MLGLGRRYAHVPLGGVTLLLMIAVIAWLLEQRVDGVWDPALRIAAPVPTAVTIAPGPAESATAPGPADAATREVPEVAVLEPAASPPPVAAAPEPPRAPARAAALPPPAPVERWALESGPFTAAESADRLEDQLNQLGYGTVRFRTQKVVRLYVVAATGFSSAPEARRAATELGGTVVEADGRAELMLDRLPSLGEAIAVARPLRARGFEVQVAEEVGPAVIYHVRYGQFDGRAVAEARSEALALLGVQSRVVKVK